MKKYRIAERIIENKRIVSTPDYRDMGAVLLFIFLFPYIVTFFFGNVSAGYEEAQESTSFIVCNTTLAGTEKMPLETYLACRLPATIDTSYEPETLKAQAVILRTELMKAYRDSLEQEGENPANSKEQDGKKYIYVESIVAMTDGEEYEKCREAVNSTRGMYMTYKEKPIKAPYFALSAGMTRNGNEVLKSMEYPYLKSVMCERDFTAKEYVQTVRIKKTAFLIRMQEVYPGIVWEEGKELTDMLRIDRDRANYVTKIEMGGSAMSGETFRSIFSLNSSCFTVELENNAIIDDTVVIKVKGVGHGLGFCQYAANEAAKKGSDFIDILNYYFTDIVIEKTE
ncbi:stage II sporulation protein D [Kineothrix alysoides]|uniref:Stage II sporulation protein D n=1 Tax=Kineothrix alysoides TaxID=1469948 RepID=A0A4R1R6B9_9FIRM|nr:SpoIID/LytB domain-containing protein [Kineothrix alysoides]TCL61104.1 stage II sporulation protein D [Kineothrix alysoides]